MGPPTKFRCALNGAADSHGAEDLFDVSGREATTQEQFVDTTQAPREGHFLVDAVGQGLRTVIDVSASTLSDLGDAVSNVLPAHSLDASGSSASGTASFHTRRCADRNGRRQ